MPKIPQYNQGRGLQTRLASGRLSPRIDSSVYERAALASLEPLATALEGTADFFKLEAEQEQVRVEKQRVAAERAAKEAEELQQKEYETKKANFSLSEDNRLRIESSAWLAEYNYTTPEQFEKDWAGFSASFSDNANADFLNAEDKVRHGLEVQSKMITIRGSGLQQAYKVDEENTANLYAATAENISNNYVNGTLSIESALNSYDMHIASNAADSGIEVISREEFKRQLFGAKIGSIAAAPNSSMSEVETLLREVRTNEDYGDTPEEREVAAAPLVARLDKMQGQEADVLRAGAVQVMAKLVMSTTAEGHSAAAAEARQIVGRLTELGQTAAAVKLEEQVSASENSFNFMLVHALSNGEELQIAIAGQDRIFADMVANGNATGALAGKQALSETVQRRKEAIEADPALYVANAHNRISGSYPTATQTIELQRQIGVPEEKLSPFTNEAFESLTETLETSPNGQSSLNALKDFFGGMDEETEDLAVAAAMRKGMTAAQNIALFTSDTRRATDLLNAASRNDKELNDTLKGMDVDVPDLSERLNELLEDFVGSVVHPGSLDSGYLSQFQTGAREQQVINIQGTLLKLAKVYALQHPPKRAVELAADVIMGEYGWVDNDKAPVRVPNSYKGNTEQIGEILPGLLMQPGFVEGIAIAPAQDATSQNLNEEARLLLYARKIREHGRWMTADDDSGVILTDAFGNAVETLVEGRAVPVFYTWDKIIEMGLIEAAPAPLQEEISKATRTFTLEEFAKAAGGR